MGFLGRWIALACLAACSALVADALLQAPPRGLHSARFCPTALRAEGDTNESDEANDRKEEQEAAAERWKQQAEELREQIQKMEADLPEKPLREPIEPIVPPKPEKEPVSFLDGKNILLVGANGRLGSMVCRRLLRQYPEIANVVAMVHVVGENSETSRGYGRLAYEVGAEDGRGSIGPAWSAEDRTATFEFDEEVMTPYNLQKLRVVECEVRNLLAFCALFGCRLQTSSSDSRGI
jgi:hypothetical protein